MMRPRSQDSLDSIRMATAKLTVFLDQRQRTFAIRVPRNPLTPLFVESRGLILQMQKKRLRA